MSNEIILLLDDDDDECEVVLETPSPFKRRGKRQKLSKPDEDVKIIDLEEDSQDLILADDGLEIIEPPPAPELEFFEPPNKNTSMKKSGRTPNQSAKSTNNKKRGTKAKKGSQAEEDDDEVQAVGRTKALHLPHLRMHCLEHPFTPKITANKKNKIPWDNNKKHCEMCYCYVCDVPVGSCSDWSKHCLAFDKGKGAEKWRKKRETLKKRKTI